MERLSLPEGWDAARAEPRDIQRHPAATYVHETVLRARLAEFRTGSSIG